MPTSVHCSVRFSKKLAGCPLLALLLDCSASFFEFCRSFCRPSGTRESEAELVTRCAELRVQLYSLLKTPYRVRQGILPQEHFAQLKMCSGKARIKLDDLPKLQGRLVQAVLGALRIGEG